MASRLKQSRLPAALIRSLAVLPMFHLARFFLDQMFLVRLDNPRIRPVFFAHPLSLLCRTLNYFGRLFRHEYNDYALTRYAKYQRHHYGPDGRGYFSYDNISDTDKIKLYGYPEGRLGSFIDAYGPILDYRNGDRFFDCGCGRGQNVKVLLDRFDRSEIRALDISAEAVSIIDLATKGERVATSSGDVTDPAILGTIADKSCDHAIISHVFSLLICPGLEKTKAARAHVVKELLRIARKSVLIIDEPAAISDHERFVIEQWNRGFFAEYLPRYFPAEGGRIYRMRAGLSEGILFVCD
ncbi:MAG: class I SAM-dependent methyltransferase [Rhodospirillales bacterium]